MNIEEALTVVTNKEDLEREQMADVMRLVMSGEATNAQIGGLLVGLRMKGETTQEIRYGQSCTEVTAQPDTSYHFVKWSDDDRTAARTLTNVASDINLTFPA